MRRWYPLALAALAWLGLTTAAGAQAARDGFVADYRCVVVRILLDVHGSGDRAREDNRFLVLALHGRSQRYVQCAFFDEDRHLMCEASSGFFGPKAGEAGHFRPDPRAVARFGALGFSTDGSQGNFQKVVPVAGTDTFETVADLLLGALYDGFGASRFTSLRATAPLVYDGILPPAPCAPGM